MNRLEFEKECYLLSRYKEYYITTNEFNEKASALIEEALSLDADTTAADPVKFMEEMLKGGDLYEDMDKKYAPILIYTGDTICYGVLDEFARRLSNALSGLGYTVELFDLEESGPAGLADFIGKRFTAIIGMQTYAFSVQLKDGSNLHDHIIGPKFNMIFDHPVWLRDHLTKGPKDYFVLTHDINYVNFTKRYFPTVKGVYLLPPGGSEGEGTLRQNIDREYEVSFIGSYHDWRLWWHQIRDMNRKTKGLVRAFMTYAKQHPDVTWEQGLNAVLSERNATLSDEEFRDLLFNIKPVCFVVMSFYREKLLDELAGAGVKVHVFGESWNVKRYAASSFIKHSQVAPSESLYIYSKSKISINIMSWHKAGMTERLANMMLNGCVVVTDTSEYLEKNYNVGQDYIELSLHDAESAPMIIEEVLKNTDRLLSISKSAYEKAKNRETWAARANEFVDILESIRGS